MVVPCVLAGKIHSKSYDILVLCSEISNMLYSKNLKMKGWEEHHISYLDKLLWTHAIKAEEFYGTSICTENLEYSTHVTSDIFRHSSPDNYSCDLYERAIRTIKVQKHNSKSIEPTYVEWETIRQFIQCYELKHGSLYDFTVERYPVKFDTEQDFAKPVYLYQRSFDAAKKLLNIMFFKSVTDRYAKRLVNGGVLIGKLSKKRDLTDSQYHDIKTLLREIHGQQTKLP